MPGARCACTEVSCEHTVLYEWCMRRALKSHTPYTELGSKGKFGAILPLTCYAATPRRAPRVKPRPARSTCTSSHEQIEHVMIHHHDT